MKCAVIIPAYHASSSLGELLERTLAVHAPDDTLVIDDGSKDGTAEIARSHGVRIITHDVNRGKGAALSTGFDFARMHGYDAVVTMDSDLQHQPEDIPRLLRAYGKTKRDIIIGSRLHSLGGMPYHRRLSNLTTTWLVRARTGAPIEDSQSGFRFIHMRVLERVRPATTGFEAETELIIRAALLGFTFGSIPIDTIYAGEKSSMTHWQTTKRFVGVLLMDF